MELIEQNQSELREKFTSITSVINLIDNIAKETHLLALNASIEAAAAGSFGSRFAVVAAEVKNLADRAVRATTQVKGIVLNLSEAISQASNSTTEGLIEAEKAVNDTAQSDK